MIKGLQCYIKAIPLFIKTKQFIPHIYKEKNRFIHNIVVTDTDFSLTDTFCHDFGEYIVRDAIVINFECKCCGKTIQLWKRNNNVPVIKTDE